MKSRNVAKDPLLGKLLSRIKTPWRIDPNARLRAAPAQFAPPPRPLADELMERTDRDRLQQIRDNLEDLHAALYAAKQHGVLLVFQALDAAGKDGVIKQVLKGLDPAGIRVASFKRPTDRELSHDFLWRTSKELPERGCITAFNRSYYEEVLAVRVHPEFLEAQYAGAQFDRNNVWKERYRAIVEHERHLANANTLVLKFWLNVSRQEQAKRFLERLEDPQKSWKFSLGDVAYSELRASYDEALKHMLNETSRPWAPWFCVPADDPWYLRAEIADIVHQALSLLAPRHPAPDLPAGKELEALKAKLRKRSRER